MWRRLVRMGCWVMVKLRFDEYVRDESEHIPDATRINGIYDVTLAALATTTDHNIDILS